MKYNTRFNPSINGPLHIGHLYMALVNEAEAHRSGGEFVVRVDDMQTYWNQQMGQKLVDQYYNEYVEQLSRFMIIDVWHRQSHLPSAREIIGDHNLFDLLPANRPLWKMAEIRWREEEGQWVWPYSPYATLEKVVWDFWENINLVIRGEDLVTEANLYTFFERQIGLLRPSQVYLPRLSTQVRGNIGRDFTTGELSKTIGNYVLSQQIDKFGVEEISAMMRQSCLIDPEGEFYIENIKPDPVVVGFEE